MARYYAWTTLHVLLLISQPVRNHQHEPLHAHCVSALIVVRGWCAGGHLLAEAKHIQGPMLTFQPSLLHLLSHWGFYRSFLQLSAPALRGMFDYYPVRTHKPSHFLHVCPDTTVNMNAVFDRVLTVVDRLQSLDLVLCGPKLPGCPIEL